MANDVRARASLQDDLSGPLTRIGDAWNKQAKSFATGALAARAVETAFSLAGRAVGGVTDFLGDSAKAASDLAESLGKSNVVFGANADEIEEWAARGAQAFGLSKQAALEAAGTYGNLFQAFGVGRDEATKMSTTLVELAADLASFNNTSIEEAIQALRSGLSGETEPLKRYGIAISDARMRAELLAQGYKNLGSTLTPLQKTTAAYALVLKDSALAQGDFARTADGVANKQRILNAEIENLKADVGQGLLPLEREWLSVSGNLLRGIDFLADSINYESQTLERKIELTQIDVAKTQGATKAAAEQRLAILLSTQAAIDRAKAYETSSLEARDEADALERLADKTRKAASDSGTLKGALRELGYKADDAEGAIDDLATTISDELFGDAINAGNLAQLRETHAELVKQRDETKKGSREYKILTGEIAENKQAQFDLQLQMAQEEGPDAVLAFLDKAQTKYGTNNARIQTMIDKLRSLYALLVRYNDLGVIDFGRYDGKIIPGFHSGGRPTPGEPAIVGEKGPELFVPDTAGTVIPAGSWGGGTGGASGSPVVINVALDGAVIARVVDRRLRYASPRSAFLPD